MILALDNVKVAFGARPILKGVSLKIESGEIYALLGRKEAGKSTTIRAALGLVPVWDGSVRLLGRDPHSHGGALRSRIGLLCEQNSLPDWMTGQQYLAHFAALHRLKLLHGELCERLSQVGLETAATQTIATYSRVMKQRLGLAQAMIANPPLLILDEPTDGLPTHDRLEFHDILKALASQGTAILLCTQFPDDIERLTSRVGIIDDGRTVLDGWVSDLLEQRSLKLAYRLRLTGKIPVFADNDISTVKLLAHDGAWASVEIEPGVAPETVWRELVFRGWPIAEIVRTGGGLSELYHEVASHQPPDHRRAA